jgi:hypothetical protein
MLALGVTGTNYIDIRNPQESGSLFDIAAKLGVIKEEEDKTKSVFLSTGTNIEKKEESKRYKLDNVEMKKHSSVRITI